MEGGLVSEHDDDRKNLIQSLPPVMIFFDEYDDDDEYDNDYDYDYEDDDFHLFY